MALKNWLTYLLLAIFGSFIIALFLYIATYRNDPAGTTDTSGLGDVVIWGVLEEEHLAPSISKEALYNYNSSRYVNTNTDVVYEFYPRDSIINLFLEASAAGNAPDLLLLPHEEILRHQDKLYTIPYENYPKFTFSNSFVDSTSILLSEEGVLGIPFAVDPLVLFYNDNFNKKYTITQIPKTWQDVVDVSSLVLESNNQSVIDQAVIPLGVFSNNPNAKDILALLLLQSEVEITKRDSFDNELVSDIDDNRTIAREVLYFFTSFADSSQVVYSWNRSLANAPSFFTSGKLYLYPGFASEYPALKKLTAGLPIEVTVIPQATGSEVPKTFSRIYAFAVPKSVNNLRVSLALAYDLTSPTLIGNRLLDENSIYHIPSPLRIHYSKLPTDVVRNVFYESAFIGVNWVDLNFERSYQGFNKAVNSIVTGARDSSRAVDFIEDALE